MIDPSDDPSDFKRNSEFDRADRVCDLFEQEWIAGRQPDVEDYLGDTNEPERSRLRRELEIIELDYLARDPAKRALPIGSMDSASAGDARGDSGQTSDMVQQFGRYRTSRQIGHGGFGEVWLAHDGELDRPVAIKLPLRRGRVTTASVDRMRSEARIAAALDHPNIVPVYDLGNLDDGRVYIVSKFIDGNCLADCIDNDRRTPEGCARLAADLADALQHSHQQGLIHRDVKPANILIDESGRPYLADFGLALTDQEFGRGARIAGTPAYMSPEQARGEGHLVDGRSDVFSLGVVLYELLTGRRPFRGETPDEILKQIEHLEPRPPRQYDAAIPRELENICLKAVSKTPSDRYGTAGDFRDALRGIVKSPAGQSDSMSPDTQAVMTTTTSRGADTSIDLTRPVSATGESGMKSVLVPVAACTALALAMLALAIAGRSNSNGHSDEEATAPAEAEASAASSPKAGGPKRVRLSIGILNGEQFNPTDDEFVPAAPDDVEHVVFYPLDETTGVPEFDQRISSNGANPVDVELLPGDYLVVVVVENYGFHEVLRQVPGDSGSGAGIHAHSWFRLDPADGTVELRAINVLRDTHAVQGMALLAGQEHFEMGDSRIGLVAPVHERRVPAFYLDVTEVTARSFRGFMGVLPYQLRTEHNELQRNGVDITPLDLDPVTYVSYDEAIAFAERAGRRLPCEAEYEWAATNGGTQQFPWGDMAEPAQQWAFGAAGQPTFDRLDSVDPPVRGLYSNVAEWTASWAADYPQSVGFRSSDRIIRGAPESVLSDRLPNRPLTDKGPRNRIVDDRRNRSRRLGFRCARSPAPRLQREDFVVRLDDTDAGDDR